MSDRPTLSGLTQDAVDRDPDLIHDYFLASAGFDNMPVFDDDEDRYRDPRSQPPVERAEANRAARRWLEDINLSVQAVSYDYCHPSTGMHYFAYALSDGTTDELGVPADFFDLSADQQLQIGRKIEWENAEALFDFELQQRRHRADRSLDL